MKLTKERTKVTRPMITAGSKIVLFKNERLIPIARASILVATESVSRT